MGFGIGLLIGLLIFAVIAVVGFVLLKSIFKAISIAVALMFIASIVFGVLVLSDIRSMSKHMKTDDKLILIADGNDVVYGFKMGDMTKAEGKEFGEILKSDTVTFAQKSELDSYSSSLAEGNYKAILGDNYKLFLADLKMFEQVDVYDFNGMQFSGEFLISVIKSDTPMDTFMTDDAVDKLFASETLKLPATLQTEQERQDYIADVKKDKRSAKSSFLNSLGSEDGMKIAIMASMLNSLMQENPAVLISEFQKGNIKVHKETITFKLMKFMPVSLIKMMAGKMQG